MFLKFGITSKYNVEDRFDTKYERNAKYKDFNLKVEFSVKTTPEKAEILEKHFLEKYPKNFILENEVGVNFGYYDDFSGLTEWYKPTLYERKQILKEAYKIREKLWQ